MVYQAREGPRAEPSPGRDPIAAEAKSVILPTDFNCMCRAVPTQSAPSSLVPIAGDGALMTTCMESLAAATNNLGVVYVFNDGVDGFRMAAV